MTIENTDHAERQFNYRQFQAMSPGSPLDGEEGSQYEARAILKILLDTLYIDDYGDWAISDQSKPVLKEAFAFFEREKRHETAE